VSFALVPERPRIPPPHLIGPPDSERRFVCSESCDSVRASGTIPIE
jgi:hypothetical protein